MTLLAHTFQVALFDQFLESFARIPRAQQKKVNAFIRKFRANPAAPSIDYEKIHSFADPNLRTVRIDDAYRAIVLRPDEGNVCVLLWVDHHDEAIAWARHKRVEVHPGTGSLQVYTLQAPLMPLPVSATGSSVAAATPGLPRPVFQQLADGDLLSVGVPAALLPAVRQVCSAPDLARLSVSLPAEAHEALSFLLEGEPLDEVKRALGLEQPPATEVRDLVTALDRDLSRRSFVVVADDEALAAMLDAPLEKWRIFLHPSQRALVQRSWSGPVRVLGGAGTGKTVVAMHRAAWLVQQRFPADDDRVLFTTFTRNLAADIAANLAKLLPGPALRRVEVVHLDKWITDFLHSRGYRYEIDYWQRGSGRLWELWHQALDAGTARELPESFFREEWESVVQSQGCRTEEEYLMASRAGRGVRLSRPQRRAIWAVFEEYRNLLEEHGLRESVDAMHDAAGLLERREAVLGYRAILVDEAQDMSTAAFTLIRRMIPEQREDDLFIVGDGHQRIYRRQVVLGQAGVKVVGRSRRLKVNYRTTDEIRRYAVALLEGLTAEDLDGGQDTTQGYKSLMHGAPPVVRVLPDREAEVQVIIEFVRQGEAARTCLVARTKALLERYEAALSAGGIVTYRLRRTAAEDPAAPGLRLATLHRVKGLEFDRVILAGVDEETLPLRSLLAGTEDPAVREDLERQERALFYVAVTRARREVLITCGGKPSPWIRHALVGGRNQPPAIRPDGHS